MPRGKPEQAEQIIPKLREVEVELGRGKTVADASWIDSARGKAVKIVSPLVRQLPRGDTAVSYLVVHMRRPVAEVVASQRAMLARAGRPGAAVLDEALIASFERQLVA